MKLSPCLCYFALSLSFPVSFMISFPGPHFRSLSVIFSITSWNLITDLPYCNQNSPEDVRTSFLRIWGFYSHLD